MHIGERVCWLRRLKGLSQRDLAKEISSAVGRRFFQSQIASIEQGVRNIKSDELQAFSKIFSVPYSFFFRNEIPGRAVFTALSFKVDNTSHRFAELQLRQILFP